ARPRGARRQAQGAQGPEGQGCRRGEEGGDREGAAGVRRGGEAVAREREAAARTREGAGARRRGETLRDRPRRPLTAPTARGARRRLTVMRRPRSIRALPTMHRTTLAAAVLLISSAPSFAQVAPGDIAVTGFSSSAFGVIGAGPSVT